MADGSIVIDTRLNNKGAAADLAALQSKCKSTAQQIAALDKRIAETKGNSKIADSLKAAEQQATETAAALDAVNAKLDAVRAKNHAGVQAEYPGMSAGRAASIAESRTMGSNAADISQSDALNAKLTEQQAKVAALSAQYKAQQADLAGLETARGGLVAQLNSESEAAGRAATAAKTQEAAKAALTDVIQRAVAAVKKFGQALITHAVNGVKKLLPQLNKASSGMGGFAGRLKSIVGGALIFNGISAALRSMTSYMTGALQQSGVLKTALANLKGAAATAAAPLIQALSPALAAIANAAATAFSYISKLIALLTGKSVTASAAAAKGMAGVGTAAGSAAKQVEKAGKTLAGFDEIEKLDAPKADTGTGGGGGSADTTADAFHYDFGGTSPFLDSVLAAIGDGEWYRVGQLVGEKLRDSLNAIPWPDIQSKAAEWATSLAATINGFIETPGMWEALGHTVAQGLNTITTAIDAFVYGDGGVHWQSLGEGLANGLQLMQSEINWEGLGLTLAAGLYAALGTLHGFVTTYDGWAELGTNIAAMLGTAIGSIDWVQAMGDLSTLAIGVLTAINTALGTVQWDEVQAKLWECLQAIDWPGLLNQVGQLIHNLMPLLLPVLLIAGAKAALGLLFTSLVTMLTGKISTLFAATVLPAIAKGFGAVITAIGGWPVLLGVALVAIGLFILTWIYKHWDEIKESIKEGFAWIDEKLDKAGQAIEKAWDDTWTTVSNTVGEIWDGIVAAIKGAINGILGFINGMISGICDGLNTVIGLMNKLSFDVPDWVPELGGKTFGFDISTLTAPQIPLLAQGAVIPANHEFMAVLGDQAHGTNIEAPLDTIKQAVAEVLANTGSGAGYELLDARLQELIAVVCDIRVGDETIAGAVNRYNSKMTMVRGGTV